MGQGNNEGINALTLCGEGFASKLITPTPNLGNPNLIGRMAVLELEASTSPLGSVPLLCDFRQVTCALEGGEDFLEYSYSEAVFLQML